MDTDPMKSIRMIVILGTLLPCLVLPLACSKTKHSQKAQGWSDPVGISVTSDGLVGEASLYKWRGTVMAWQAINNGKCLLMDPESNSWTEAHLDGLNAFLAPAVSKDGNNLLFDYADTTNDQFILRLSSANLSFGSNIHVQNNTKWATDKVAFFGETPSNIHLNDVGNSGFADLGPVMTTDSDSYIPFSVQGTTCNAAGIETAYGPFSSGILHSKDSGSSWRVEKLADFEAQDVSMCLTKQFCYFFVARPVMDQGLELLFSRGPVGAGQWDGLGTVTKTFGKAFGHYLVLAEGDMVHLCWTDCRHETKRVSLVYPHRQNYEIAYCGRRDTDTNWNKDVILSKGTPYTYAPSMSAEGDNVVVVWSGIETSPNEHSETDPNDIFYVTSRDAGKTWARPLKLTDGAKDGITSGEPSVVLQNGIIHLVYIQGKIDAQQLSPGLTKLTQPPWPIYYQQRSFPD